jgi:hypothetical protein
MFLADYRQQTGPAGGSLGPTSIPRRWRGDRRSSRYRAAAGQFGTATNRPSPLRVRADAEHIDWPYDELPSDGRSRPLRASSCAPRSRSETGAGSIAVTT